MGSPRNADNPPIGPSPVPAADAAAFRSLCRSSPWRWTSLRFEVSWQPADGGAAADGGGAAADGGGAAAIPAVRAWLRRPGALRVESPDGKLLASTTGINDSRDGLYTSATRKSWLLPPNLVTPVYDHQGLVRRRPEAAYGEPVFEDARWSAMLDPVELSGSSPVGFESPFSNVVDLESVSEVELDGRRALEAVLSPTAAYVPATPGHPLLGAGRTRVAVDWETAVCTATTALDGPSAGAGHRLRILGVDEYMLDDLFVETSMHLTDVRRHIPWEVA